MTREYWLEPPEEAEEPDYGDIYDWCSSCCGELATHDVSENNEGICSECGLPTVFEKHLKNGIDIRTAREVENDLGDEEYHRRVDENLSIYDDYI